MRIALEPREGGGTWTVVAAPLAALAASLVVGGVLLGLLGHSPFEALYVYFVSPLTEGYTRAEILVKLVPLALIGAGLAVSFRANVWNIGAAGQYTMGALIAGALALVAPQGATGLHWLILYLIVGVGGGMAWAAVPAFLRTRFGTNEILVSLMLTYVAALALDWAVRGPLRDPAAFGFPQSRDFPDGFLMPVLMQGTRLHAGVLLAVAVAVGLALMMAYTRRGFSLRVMGTEPRAGRFAGFSENGTVWFALLLSGGLAGLAGAVEVSATVSQLQPDISASYGFTAIIVAFLGRLNPLGALFGALVLALSDIGGENAQIMMQLPRNATALFQGMLLLFLLAADTLTRYRVRLIRPGEAGAPAAAPPRIAASAGEGA
ncbi:MAG: ABC transporter permease [Pseudomonadota bacterium]